MQQLVDAELAAGKKTIVIPPGRHRVKPANRQHLVLRGLRDVEIVAEGAELICTETTRALTIDQCRNVVVRGLTVDYDPLPYTQGRITALSEDKQTHDIKLLDGFPNSEGVVNAKYEIFRPDTRTLRFGSYHGFSVEKLDPGHIRVTKAEHYARSPFKPERIGDIVAINSVDAPGGSIPHAVTINDSVGVKLEGITLHASNCFGFLETSCDGTMYLRCGVARRPAETDLKPRGETRVRSLDADAFHSTGAARGPAYVECSAAFMGDDCINIHGDYHLVTACSGDRLRVLAKRTMRIEPGESVELVSYTGERLPDAAVVSVTPDGRIDDAEKEFLSKQKMRDQLKSNQHGALAKAYTIILDQSVDLPTGSVICSQRRIGNGFLVKDCDFGYNRSRGILIKASNGKVVGNRLTENWGEAIKVAPEYYWLEAGSSNDVVIRDNVIRDCRSVSIAVYAHGGEGAVAPAGAHRNITVAGNSIVGGPLPSILVTSTRGLVLEANDIRPETDAALLPWVRHSLLGSRPPEPVMLINTEKPTFADGASVTYEKDVD